MVSLQEQYVTKVEANDWVELALKDGWSIGPTYPGHEEASVHGKMNKDGWVAHVDRRDYPKHLIPARRNGGNICVWAPDGMAVEVCYPYSWEKLQENAKKCSYCGKIGEVIRIGFAGRTCRECHKVHVDKIEHPGWCD